MFLLISELTHLVAKFVLISKHGMLLLSSYSIEFGKQPAHSENKQTEHCVADKVEWVNKIKTII